MPAVTGSLNTITGIPLADSRDAVIRFTLNQGNVRNNSRVIPDMWYDVTPNPDTGEFEVQLQQTTDMFLDAWYEVSVHFQQSPSSTNASGMAMISYLGLRIRVPSSGGDIAELVDFGAGAGGTPGPNNRIVWVSQTPPSHPRPFMLWLEQEPGATVDPFDPRNTGVLHEWRN